MLAYVILTPVAARQLMPDSVERSTECKHDGNPVSLHHAAYAGSNIAGTFYFVMRLSYTGLLSFSS